MAPWVQDNNENKIADSPAEDSLAILAAQASIKATIDGASEVSEIIKKASVDATIEASAIPKNKCSPKDKSSFMTLLRYLGNFIPGNYLKTFMFLNFVSKPRRIIRDALWAFYRMEHIYDVLFEARQNYAGKFSILEFGTNEGYSLRKMLYATRYTGLEERVTVHGFDTFEGMPSTDDSRDLNIMTGEHEWTTGQFQGGKKKLEDYCRNHYRNFALHQGIFENSIDEVFLQEIAKSKPILVWFDADYYSSTVSAMLKILPYLPNGCVLYFDEYEFGYGSRFTGEARVVHEINNGLFGNDIELILDTRLSLNSQRIYRFLRNENQVCYELNHPLEPDPGRSPTNDSPMP